MYRVAANESANRMTSTNLGVIFGPCLLRCERNLEPTISLAHVQLQTALVLLIYTKRVMKDAIFYRASVTCLVMLACAGVSSA